MVTTHEGGPVQGIDEQPHGGHPDEPWLAFLLGCVSLARRAAARTRPTAPRMPAEDPLGPEDAPSAASGGARSGSRPDATVYALLGVAALAGRFEALLGQALADAASASPTRRSAPVAELLR